MHAVTSRAFSSTFLKAPLLPVARSLRGYRLESGATMIHGATAAACPVAVAPFVRRARAGPRARRAWCSAASGSAAPESSAPRAADQADAAAAGGVSGGAAGGYSTRLASPRCHAPP